MSTPKPLPVSGNSALGPSAARIAAQDAQITQLVQQNKALEKTISQLRAEVEMEKKRGAEAVNQMRQCWKAESAEWREGCDSLQAKHRLAHLETRMSLEHERGYRLEDREALLREKTAVLLREYKITLFQARETELVAQIANLEDEIESLQEERIQTISLHDAEVSQIALKLAKTEGRLNESSQQLVTLAQQKKALETDIANLSVSSSTNSKQVDRLNLQLESLRTQNATLESRGRELQHQVDKWQTLENKGEKEVEALRQRRIELEVRVKELELGQKEHRGADKKITKLEASLLESHEQLEQSQQDIAKGRKQISKLERQTEELQAALEAEKDKILQLKDGITRQQTASKSSSKARLPSVIEEAQEDDSESEMVEKAAPRSRSKKPESTSREKPATNTKARSSREEGATKTIVKPVAGGKKDRQFTRETEDEQAEQHGHEEPGVPVDDVDTDEDEVKLPQSKKHRSIRGGQGVADAKKPQSKTSAIKVSSAEEGASSKKRARSKPPSKVQSQNADDSGGNEETEEPPAKKKKRKINTTSIFGGEARFTWNQDEGGGLGIPTDLSPVKEGQLVPPRSNSALGGRKLWK